METVIALSSFEHYGSRRRDEEFFVSAAEATKLIAAGLVEVKAHEQKAEKPKPKRARNTKK